MRSGVRAEPGRNLYGVLLILGLYGLFNLLLSNLGATLSAGAVPATGELLAKLTPLTQGPSMDGFGAWSPDGKQIAFMRDGQILLTDPTGKKVNVLTSQPNYWDADPAWRPDQQSLAFIRVSMQDEQTQVMELPLKGGQPKELVRERESIGYIAWTPDGRSLLYTTKERIMRVDRSTGKSVKLFQAPEGWELLSGGITVTPDGKAMIFGGGPRLERGVAYDLWRLPIQGGSKAVQLTTQGGIMPTLDSNGQVLFYRNPRTETGIWRLTLATGAAQRTLADDPKSMYFHPNLSPDGQRLVVSRLLLTTPPTKGKGGFTSNLYLLTLDGRGGDRP